MGYRSRVIGSLVIKPPLQLDVINGSRFLPRHPDEGNLEVSYLINNDRLPPCAVAIEPAEEEEHKAYELHEQLQSIADEVIAAGSTLYGHIVRIGESQGDVERYGLGTGHAAHQIVSEKAILSWPDGELLGDCDA
jgi:hypothetical protein